MQSFLLVNSPRKPYTLGIEALPASYVNVKHIIIGDKPMHPILLFYNLDNEKGQKIKLLCLRMKIKIRLVIKAQYNQPIGALTGMKGFTALPDAYDGTGFTDEMLVFKGFSNQLLDSFLMELKKAHIERVALKAVLTEQNVTWDSMQLHNELTAEHAAMNQTETASINQTKAMDTNSLPQ